MAFLPLTSPRLTILSSLSRGQRVATAHVRRRRWPVTTATPRRQPGPASDTVASSSSSSSSSSTSPSTANGVPPPPPAAVAAAAATTSEECFDVLDADGRPTGRVKARSRVHADGDWHRSVHVWLARVTPAAASASAATAAGNEGGGGDGRTGEVEVQVDSTLQLLLQLRAADKDTYPGRWDVSAAGHIAAGDGSADTAGRELAEELGLNLSAARIGPCRYTIPSDSRGSTPVHGAFVDREHQDVYAVVLAPGEVEGLQGGRGWDVQATEVDGVAWFDAGDLRRRLATGDPALVPRSEAYVEGLWAALRELTPVQA
ncbi:hypothetical protein MMPV_008160 [Pyropia vietnamensis]